MTLVFFTDRDLGSRFAEVLKGVLLDESRLADLSGTDHRHEEAAWLPEAAGEDGGLGP